MQAAGLMDAVRMPDGSKAPPSHQHADDTTIHTKTLQGAAVAFQLGVVFFCSKLVTSAHSKPPGAASQPSSRRKGPPLMAIPRLRETPLWQTPSRREPPHNRAAVTPGSPWP